MSYNLGPEKKYWYTTDVNSVQWRYPTASAGAWKPVSGGEWFVPMKPMGWDEWVSPGVIPFPTVTIPEELKSVIDIEGIRKRLREEIFLEVREYIDKIVPVIVLMLQDRWISILGKEKKYTDGVFCFNCGAPIPRGKEKEICAYCGN